MAFHFQLIVSIAVIAANSYAQAQVPPGGNPPDSLANRATQFCLKESSTNQLKDMPMTEGNCAALATGAAVASYFSGDKRLAALLLQSNQRQWALEAIKLSCIGGDVANQAAVRLIQACNCHSPASQEAIENNQDQVRQILKIRSGGHPAYSGCEGYPPYYGTKP